MAYDATVLAGTQGMRNHQKTDRMLGIARRAGLPVVLFAEGGGGRPATSTMPDRRRPARPHLRRFARLSGRVPLLGIVAGRCFAGNAALLGCCDTIIATRDSSIGMGGPAMVEGGGLGLFRPEEIGPSDVQSRSGVIDVLVADEAEAVAVAQPLPRLLPGPARRWQEPSTRRAARAAARRTACASTTVRAIVAALVDPGSMLELRAGFGVGLVTALARIEGRAVGVLPTTRPTSAAPSTPTRPTRPPASCSSAMRTACRSSR